MSVTIAEWLFMAMQKLSEAGVDSPRRDAFVLVEDLLNKDRSWVNAHGEHNLSDEQITMLNGLIKRRVEREPLAYIRGKAWFYGRFFEVTPDVMIPRPESESFIEILKQLRPKTIIDIGTGSGCLAVIAKLEMPTSEVMAIDSSPAALEIAQQNARKHQADIKFIQGSLLKPFQSINYCQPAVIIANLPYVPEGMITSPEITHEPAEALFSGPDGLDHYREFWQQMAELEPKVDYILTESLENQHAKLESLAQKAGYKLQMTDVLIQMFKKFS